MTTQQADAGIPEGWREIYRNKLEGPAQLEGFRMEGDGAVTFPQGRLRLESTRGLRKDRRRMWFSGALRCFRRSLPSPGDSVRCGSRGWPFCSSRLPVPGQGSVRPVPAGPHGRI